MGWEPGSAGSNAPKDSCNKLVGTNANRLESHIVHNRWLRMLVKTRSQLLIIGNCCGSPFFVAVLFLRSWRLSVPTKTDNLD